jgi:hypothetical protein
MVRSGSGFLVRQGATLAIIAAVLLLSVGIVGWLYEYLSLAMMCMPVALGTGILAFLGLATIIHTLLD